VVSDECLRPYATRKRAYPGAEALGYPEANTASSDDPMHGGRTCMGERIRRRVDLDDETADDFFLQRVDCEKRSSAAEPLSRD